MTKKPQEIPEQFHSQVGATWPRLVMNSLEGKFKKIAKE